MTSNENSDEPNIVEAEYIKTGPKCLADLKLRVGKWLDESSKW